MRFYLLLALIIFKAEASEWSTHQNVSFHKSCITNFGETFPEVFHSGISHGLNCLEKLPGKASSHFQKLSELLNSGDLKVGCHEKSYNFGRLVAHASITDKHSKPDEGLIHPFVSWNPDLKFNEWFDVEFMKFTSFHEIFHNIGYAHGRTEEYAYACEECCFGEDGDNKDNACRVCVGEYEGLKDPTYIRDFVAYYDSSDWGESFIPRTAIRFGLIDNPESDIHREMLLSFDGDKSPLSIMTAKSWVDVISSEMIAVIAGYDYSEIVKAEIDFLTMVYEARMALLMDNQTERAIDIYLSLDPAPLRRIINVDKTDGRRLWNSILNDMDVLYIKMEREEHPKLSELSRKFDEVVIASPPGA